jgi:hypothetical protein
MDAAGRELTSGSGPRSPNRFAIASRAFLPFRTPEQFAAEQSVIKTLKKKAEQEKPAPRNKGGTKNTRVS